MKHHDRLRRVDELTSALLDEQLAADERRELNELLRGDPEACERYLDLAESHAALIHDHAGDDWRAQLPESESPSRSPASSPARARSPRISRPAFRRGPVIAAAAVVVLGLNGAAFLLLRSESKSESTGEPIVEGDWVAVASRLVDPEWGPGGMTPGEGDGLPPGPFRLESGLAHIEFFSGASLVVEGPAELDLLSAWRVKCNSGRLRASVPEPAQGFTVVAPDYRAVDLGTEFALSVDESGESELHVVDGEVRLDDASGRELRRLETGGGLRSRAGRFEPVAGTGDGFVDRRQLLGLAEAGHRARHHRWAETRQTLAEEPATRALFDFEGRQPWDSRLDNRAADGPDGAIIGARWTEGRWPGKGALEFQRITDRVRLEIPGAFDELTLSASIRVDSFDRWLSSLLLTDGFDEGEVHWQITDQGELVLGIANGSGSPNTTSPPVIRPGDLGRWMHVAVTVDRVTGRVVHYRDGEAVKEQVREDLPPLRIGGAEIGNWQSQGKGHPIRSFNGRMDEFLVLERALSPDAIRRLHEPGGP